MSVRIPDIAVLQPEDIVRYVNPSRGEMNARFVILEVHFDVPIPRDLVRLLDSELPIEPEELRPAAEYELLPPQ